MKLTDEQIENVQAQLGAQAVPDDHPAAPQLKTLFGDHTYFLDSDGLHIVETTAATEDDENMASVIRLASWDADKPTMLLPHEPEITERTVELALADGPFPDGDAG